MSEGKISEIFLSLQGEGIYLGVQQIFVRFYGCDLGCAFCDTNLDTYKTYTYHSLIDEIGKYEQPFHSISLTGGEPLLQADFIEDFLCEYKELYKKGVYLETNGTLHEELSKIIDYVDVVAMDFKLPSSTGKRSYWAEHEEFLKIARKKKTFVKAVVTSETKHEDILRMREVVKRVASNTPIVLQPVTASEKNTANSKLLENFRRILKELIDRVEIIPQMHKIIGVE